MFYGISFSRVFWLFDTAVKLESRTQATLFVHECSYVETKRTVDLGVVHAG